ncbi:alpha/beta fold hydrolase [Nonomuraea mangrovi]|uniref:Alpha/beta fold hydrolase n=1 Tax=Nonomuraea mangrovi TaxID=2316207 RepID=A0ABW4SXP8_9ACTN
MIAHAVLTLALLGPMPSAALDPSPAPSASASVPAERMERLEVTVPVDWSKPEGRSLTLKVGRLRATGRSAGSVLIAYGGPGAPGIRLTESMPQMWADLRKRMDIVTWDTRGYGEQFQGTSTGLPCVWTRVPIPAFPRDDAEFARMTDTNRGIAEACRNRDPELFANMSSADHARDMEAIRKALGEPKLTFYGASYAGFYGQAYARLFPGKVRAMVLDGTWNHATADWTRELEDTARQNEQAMGRYFVSCEAAACKPSFWRRLVARADRSPVPAGAGVAYDGRDLQGLAMGFVRQGPEGWKTLTAAIEKAARGDASGFVPPRGLRYPDVATGVTECVDWPRFGTRKEMAATVARLNAIAPSTGTANTLATATLTCVGWPVKVTNPPSPLPKGLPPLLGAGAWGESDAVARVLAQVPGSGLVRHEGPGHTLYPSNACARDHVNRYLTDLVVPAKGTTC